MAPQFDVGEDGVDGLEAAAAQADADADADHDDGDGAAIADVALVGSHISTESLVAADSS